MQVVNVIQLVRTELVVFVSLRVLGKSSIYLAFLALLKYELVFLPPFENHQTNLPLIDQAVATVLSNSFGFGGNNGCLVIARPDIAVSVPNKEKGDLLAIHGIACLTGAGLTQATIDQLRCGAPVAGMLTPEKLASRLPAKLIRRLKRLARLALLLAGETHADTCGKEHPSAIFMGTGWGALSETWDFLHRLTE